MDDDDDDDEGGVMRHVIDMPADSTRAGATGYGNCTPYVLINDMMNH